MNFDILLDFDTFVAIIKSELPAVVDAKAPDYNVEFDITPKVNGAKKSIRGGKVGENIMKNIYFDDMYDEYKQHQDLEKTISDIIHIIKADSTPVKSDEFIDLVNNPDEIKKLISYFVVSREFNEELLKDIPHRKFLDLAVIYKFSIYSDDDSVGRVMITNDMAERWNMTEEDLYRYASINTEQLNSTIVRKLTSDFIIITNEDATNGASAILNERIISSIADDIGEDIYIVPSSIHDLIVLRESMYNSENIIDVIKHVNDNVVNNEDVLSYSLYKYSLEKKEICIV